MQRVEVESSNIKSVGMSIHKSGTTIMEVEFKGGGIYQYRDVPLEKLMGFLAAPSKGTYFSQEIKPHFQWRKMEVSGRWKAWQNPDGKVPIKIKQFVLPTEEQIVGSLLLQTKMCLLQSLEGGIEYWLEVQKGEVLIKEITGERITGGRNTIVARYQVLAKKTWPL